MVIYYDVYLMRSKKVLIEQNNDNAYIYIDSKSL